MRTIHLLVASAILTLSSGRGFTDRMSAHSLRTPGIAAGAATLLAFASLALSPLSASADELSSWTNADTGAVYYYDSSEDPIQALAELTGTTVIAEPTPSGDAAPGSTTRGSRALGSTAPGSTTPSGTARGSTARGTANGTAPGSAAPDTTGDAASASNSPRPVTTDGTPSPDSSFALVVVYDGTNFTGASNGYFTTDGSICSGQIYGYSSLGSWNDRIESLETFNGCAATLYLNINYGGSSFGPVGAANTLGSFNNQASSMRVQ